MGYWVNVDSTGTVVHRDTCEYAKPVEKIEGGGITLKPTLYPPSITKPRVRAWCAGQIVDPYPKFSHSLSGRMSTGPSMMTMPGSQNRPYANRKDQILREAVTIDRTLPLRLSRTLRLLRRGLCRRLR